MWWIKNLMQIRLTTAKMSIDFQSHQLNIQIVKVGHELSIPQQF